MYIQSVGETERKETIISLIYYNLKNLTVKVKWKLLSHVQLFGIPWTIQSMEFSKSECWSSLSLLQGIFPTQGSNPGLPQCRQILYQLSHKGSPRILEWVAYPFSSKSFWPRNRTGVSGIAGGFFTNWAMREADHLTVRGNKWVEHMNFVYYWPIWDLQKKSPSVSESWVSPSMLGIIYTPKSKGSEQGTGDEFYPIFKMISTSQKFKNSWSL